MSSLDLEAVVTVAVRLAEEAVEEPLTMGRSRALRAVRSEELLASALVFVRG